MSEAPDPQTTLSTQIYWRIRSDLLSGHLPPGEKLRVQALASEYASGASPVREALSTLAAEGLVERVEQRGFRSAPATLDEFEELTRSRCLLEAAVLRASILSGDGKWEEDVVLARFRLARFMSSNNVPGPDWEVAHVGLHNTLLSACRAPTLLGFCAALRERANRYRNLARPVAYPARDVSSEHDAIAEAAIARDTERASRLLIDHYEETARYVRIALAPVVAKWASSKAVST